jgi:hypothetical protein
LQPCTHLEPYTCHCPIWNNPVVNYQGPCEWNISVRGRSISEMARSYSSTQEPIYSSEPVARLTRGKERDMEVFSIGLIGLTRSSELDCGVTDVNGPNSQ